MTSAPDEPRMPEASGAAPRRDRRWLVLAAVVPIGVAIDQVTKLVADARLELGEIVTVVDGFFQVRYSRNAGAFFSLGEQLDPGFRRVFFVVATLLAVGLIVHLYRSARSEQRLLRGGLALLVAGAIGNLVDRVRQGEVIDFLHLHYRDAFHWATFNVADIYIFVGLALLVADMLGWTRRIEKASPSEAT